MYSRHELILLAKAYLSATGVSPGTLSRYTVDNTKTIARMLRGADLLMTSGEAASIWFDLNWPDETPWPLCRQRGSALGVKQTHTPV